MGGCPPGRVIDHMMVAPTRHYRVALDPYCLEDLLQYRLSGALYLVRDLERLDPPLRIEIVLPAYLASENQRHAAEEALVRLTLVHDEDAVPPFTLSQRVPQSARGPIERGAEGDCRGLRLLRLADHLKADAVLTGIPSLLDSRHLLRQHHRFNVLPPDEFPDFVEVCARGHDLPCTALPAPTWMPLDILYPRTHQKARQFSEWFLRMAPAFTDARLSELLRSALCNRYPFILHARDAGRFYSIQDDHRLRRGAARAFRTLLNYHLMAFYFHIWGMLDTLARAANVRLSLGFDENRCGLDDGEFVKALRAGARALAARALDDRDWIARIGSVRHPAAHSALLLQQDVVADTEESLKSDAEIVEILRAEEPDFNEGLPPDLVTQCESMRIAEWRAARRRTITEDAIYVERRGGGGHLWHPMASLDFDLAKLDAIIDASLDACRCG